MMGMGSGLDTSPKIAEYDVAWGRGKELTINYANWCITEWYMFDPQKTGTVTIVGYIGDDANLRTFQYHTENRGWQDWYYFNVGNVEGSRQIQAVTSTRILYEISFSVYLPIIDDAYAYVEETGQIFFAGKNTPCYGHRNISELN